MNRAIDKNIGRTAVSVEDRVARALSLDLSPIMFKLTQGEEKSPINRDNVEQVENKYKRFLCLHLMNPTAKIVPDKLVDAFWHAHILDTSKYAADCDHVFGYFLHHFPYFGLRGEQDAHDLRDAFATTKQLYETSFGVGLGGDPEECISPGLQRKTGEEGGWRCADQVSDCDAAQCDPSECHNISPSGIALASVRPRFEYAT